VITALPPGTTEPPEGITEYYICNVFDGSVQHEGGDPCYFEEQAAVEAGHVSLLLVLRRRHR
jgi:hypothetical protein